MRIELIKRLLLRNDFKGLAELTKDLTDEQFIELTKAWSPAAREAAAAARGGSGASIPLKSEAWSSKDGWNNAEIKIEGNTLKYSDYNESKAEGESIAATKIGSNYKIDSKNDLGAFSALSVGKTYSASKVEKIVKDNFEASKKAYA